MQSVLMRIDKIYSELLMNQFYAFLWKRFVSVQFHVSQILSDEIYGQKWKSSGQTGPRWRYVDPWLVEFQFLNWWFFISLWILVISLDRKIFKNVFGYTNFEIIQKEYKTQEENKSGEFSSKMPHFSSNTSFTNDK